ncbi:uncharacterized protein EI90DRAFT_3070139 [Cantharellus anzutake]|uniref:uncharacterized protein n=1 Tax=Cantharellus anzutake TaxID=1750568 RepID=UPI001908E88A|nr:uncharacterized protein EI90DRAFT_3070139 [Cantharellus anzutake]KAF8326679.1 hypothetical protein EI90DRAFT_3070139 [Cantharellus anzutake]
MVSPLTHQPLTSKSKTAVRISHVSSWWRDVALSDTSLWCEVCGNWPRDQVLAWLRRRGKKRPILLNCHIPWVGQLLVDRELLAQLSESNVSVIRLHSSTIGDNTWLSAWNHPDMAGILSRITELHSPNVPPHDLPDANLEVLFITTIFEPQPAMPRLPRLRFLYLDQMGVACNVFLASLREMEALEVLILNGVDVWPTGPTDQLTLPNLRELTYFSGQHHSMNFLPSFAAPCLRRLHLGFDWGGPISQEERSIAAISYSNFVRLGQN